MGPGGGDLGEFTFGKRWGFKGGSYLLIFPRFANGPSRSHKGSVAGSSRRVRAQTGHRAIEGAQNQLKRRIGWPKETAPGLSWGAKVIDFNLPAATRSAPRESQRRAGASYCLLSVCF